MPGRGAPGTPREATTSSVSIVVILALAILSPALLPSVDALGIDGYPSPPDAFVVDITGWANLSAGTYVARLNVTWHESDVDNASYGYTFCQDAIYPDTLLSLNSPPDITLNACTSLNGTGNYAINNHPGWRQAIGVNTLVSCGTGGLCVNDAPAFRFNLTAWNGTSLRRGASCPVTLSLDNVDPNVNNPGDIAATDAPARLLIVKGQGFAECGSYLPVDIGGLAAVVSNPYGTSLAIPSVTNVTWRTSASDPNASATGDFDYYLRHSYSQPPKAGTSAVNYALSSTTHPLVSPGIRGANVTGFGAIGQTNILYLQALGRDNSTHARTNESCLAQVQEGFSFATGQCGNLLAATTGGTISTGPSFPMLNFTDFVAGTGFSNDSAGLILGGVFIVATGAGGLVFGGPILGVAGVVLGVIGAASLGLIPLWLLVVTFLIMAAVVVAWFNAGGSPS